MISRVAESCFWINRYLERVETGARMLDVNLSFVLDVNLPASELWKPLIIVTGEEQRFSELHGADAANDGETVQNYLVWDRDNPSSLHNSLYFARENARTIRETISQEMWQTLNNLWSWMDSKAAHQLYAKNRHDFFVRLQKDCFLFHGESQATMLHEEAFDFMRLGTVLERANQTARILDLKHHRVGPTEDGPEDPMEAAEWLAALRCCSGVEPFFKRQQNVLSGKRIAGFLLLDAAFPRSVLHNLDRAMNFLRRICATKSAGVGANAISMATELHDHISSQTIENILETGLHEEITNIVDALGRICEAVHGDFFDAPMPMSGAQSAAGATRQG